MNNSISRTSLSKAQRFEARAQFSPVFRRATQDALTRGRVAARLERLRNGKLPAAETLTPATPILAERSWSPRLLDRLQMPLTRFRD